MTLSFPTRRSSDLSDRGEVSAEASEAMAVAELQPLLRADETVVAYHSLPDRLLVWMVDRERVRERSLPVPRADLEQLVDAWRDALVHRSEEHTSELQSLMRISYAGFRLKKKKK